MPPGRPVRPPAIQTVTKAIMQTPPGAPLPPDIPQLEKALAFEDLWAEVSNPPGPDSAGPDLPAYPASNARAAARASSVTVSPASIRAISSTRSVSGSATTSDSVIPSLTCFCTRQ